MQPDRRQSRRRWLFRLIAPLVVAAVVLGAWEAIVRVRDVPTYIAPAPSVVAQTIVAEWPGLSAAWRVTLGTTLAALALAVAMGVVLAVLFSASPLLELSLAPYAVVLQVTPLVAIAPLLLLWIERTDLVLLACATIVAFFPILASTTAGLKSADPGLRDLFDLYGASRWQRLRLLLAPSATPYFLAGLKTAVNLSLVGAVVAEFVTGAAGAQSGLASAVFEGQFRLDTPKMFAALGLISLTGVGLYYATHLLGVFLLRNR
ncbi:putative aliphatic sulfonates transport permease protein SsuC [Pseudobythopirellula maris]|uniref:Putative aliphatic sulfonates transport permease protein SsuC n=1 Tax=Pseudobythopirellula maris TaxID=2527991 RepID=A0A5C5ZGR8_9BACT|nr:ABC transporter permease [Pseudobythopirellula maris]TWT86320.1 putative aliphatic sulfonates transport permease protein SsuC [Pseudobythopirellula maris]